MKKTVVYSIFTATLALAPLAFTTGCAVTQHRETAGAYVDDKKIAAEIKTKMYRDPMVKGTQVKVQSLNGVVELSGFVESQQAKDRAEQIAASTPGVVRVYNSLILPTGR
ncbi:MAG: transporter [Verrucomicrobia bacterium]|nr:MAG: transporter [Verrucomicrobiota bacterium]